MRRIRPSIVVVTFAAVVLISVAYWGFTALTARSQAEARSAIARGYERQALTSPFVLQSHTWLPSSGTWQYDYTANVSGPSALAAAKSQTNQGGYQVIATHPDVVTPTYATLYRDLITGNVTLTVRILPTGSGSYKTGPVAVTVTVSPLTGE